MFLISSLNIPWHSLELLACVLWYLPGEKNRSTSLSTSSSQELAESNLFKCNKLDLTSQDMTFSPLKSSCAPQPSSYSFALWSTELYEILQDWIHQYWIQCRNLVFWPAACAVLKAPQNAIYPLDFQGNLLVLLCLAKLLLLIAVCCFSI